MTQYRVSILQRYSIMTSTKKILIIDEDSFSKVCSAILNDEGFLTKQVQSTDQAVQQMENNGISLIVSSYPYARSLLKSKDVKDIPTIVLSDEINDGLLEIMKGINKSVCLIEGCVNGTLFASATGTLNIGETS